MNVDPGAVVTALASLARAAARHGGVEVATSVDGPRVSVEPVTAAAAPVVLGDEQKDLKEQTADVANRLGGGKDGKGGEKKDDRADPKAEPKAGEQAGEKKNDTAVAL